MPFQTKRVRAKINTAWPLDIPALTSDCHLREELRIGQYFENPALIHYRLEIYRYAYAVSIDKIEIVIGFGTYL